MNASKFDGFFNDVASDLVLAGNEYGFNGSTSISSNHYSGDRLTADEWYSLILALENGISEIYHDDLEEVMDSEYLSMLTYFRGLSAGDEISWAQWNNLVEYTQNAVNHIIDHFNN